MTDSQKSSPSEDKWTKYPKIDGSLISFSLVLFGTTSGVHIGAANGIFAPAFTQKAAPNREWLAASIDLTAVQTEKKECDTYSARLSSRGIEFAVDSMASEETTTYTIPLLAVFIVGASIYWIAGS